MVRGDAGKTNHSNREERMFLSDIAKKGTQNESPEAQTSILGTRLKPVLEREKKIASGETQGKST